MNETSFQKGIQQVSAIFHRGIKLFYIKFLWEKRKGKKLTCMACSEIASEKRNLPRVKKKNFEMYFFEYRKIYSAVLLLSTDKLITNFQNYQTS